MTAESRARRGTLKSTFNFTHLIVNGISLYLSKVRIINYGKRVGYRYRDFWMIWLCSKMLLQRTKTQATKNLKLFLTELANVCECCQMKNFNVN